MQATLLLRKAEQHSAVIESAKKEADHQRERIDKKKEQIETLQHQEEMTEKSYAYLDVLVKSESGKFIKKLEDVINYGMKAIFDDEEYQISIQTDNARASIWLDYEASDRQHVHTDIKSCGGGIRTVVGFLMQVYFIFQYDAYPLIVVDEGFSQVSSQYMPNLFALIHELCEGNDLKVLLVTHDSRVMEYADRHYEISDGEAVEL